MTCPFCPPDPSRVFFDADPRFVCLWDGFPVSPGHALVVPRRHVATWFEASREEQASLLEGMDRARQEILRHHEPTGFNLGVNIGPAAGQTVPHLHVHVIPRYDGDVPDPRGGVRHVIPGKGNYLLGDLPPASPVIADASAPWPAAVPPPRLFGWQERPLGSALRRDLARANAVDMAVAFIVESGLAPLEPYLRDVLDRGGRVRVLTGDYLNFTEPAALLRLLDLAPRERPPGEEEAPPEADRPGTGRFEARVFETDGAVGFHPKAYLIPGRSGFIGSSNLSRRALEQGLEWNLRLEDTETLASLNAEFDQLFRHSRTVPLTPAWVREYAARRRPLELESTADGPMDAPLPPPEPHAIQREALAALAQARSEGSRAGLVVLATGLGKTWLAAFDSQPFRRVLFVAHREEILRQAKATFRRIRPDAILGDYSGESRDLEADVVFGSIQTIGRRAHLDRFARDAFDYVIVDEFHHAAAATYRRLIDHFEPRFLLGLTATPDRTDGADILTLCGENVIYRCDLLEGIRRLLLAPFRYFGIADDIDFTNIPWRNGRFDIVALEQAVATQDRARNAFEQWQLHAPRRTLGFCVSQRHANFLRRFFRERGVAAAAVHAGADSDPRAESLERLAAGELSVVFAVDMFNEGVDVPELDAVFLLRPTESRILWLQQIGRGLRLSQGKRDLTILDYIGNHRTFLKSPMLLLPGAGERPQEIGLALERCLRGEADLPPGCEVTYDLRAVDILRALTTPTKGTSLLQEWFRDFRQRYGRRPTATETWHAGYDPGQLRTSHGSWFEFLRGERELSEVEGAVLVDLRDFFRDLETTAMTRSWKMLVLLGMVAEERFPGRIDLGELTRAFAHQARRQARLTADVGPALDDPTALRRLLLDHPVRAWTEGRGTPGGSWFGLEENTFLSRLKVRPGTEATLRAMTREIAEWRLARYLGREAESEPDAISGGREANGEPREAVLWQDYLREEIPRLWGFDFQANLWRQGFVQKGRHLFLLVSLEKEGMQESHQYADHFLDASTFEWQSQNRTKQESRQGQSLKNHKEQGLSVHLFVRRRRKTQRGTASPFTYCGEVDFVDWEKDAPITIRWRLREPLDPRSPLLGFTPGGRQG